MHPFHRLRTLLAAGTLLLPFSVLAQEAKNVAEETPHVLESTAKALTSPDLAEQTVDLILHHFGMESAGNTSTHFIVSGSILLLVLLLRGGLVSLVFRGLKRLASRTSTNLDDVILHQLEAPAKMLLLIFGLLLSLKVLKLPESLDDAIAGLYRVILPTVVFWALIRTIGCIFDTLAGVAKARDMGIAAFMPLLKKIVIALFAILAIMTIVQSFGYDVKTFLTGLGIGGLAFALAAQDTLANLFGSFVVAIDQPFRVGEFVKIGAMEGTVEDIGMRSTKLRTTARQLIAIPNRTVANEAVTNVSRMPQRRVDMMLGLTYDTKPEQMETILEDIRGILKADAAVHPDLLVANFANYGASSLDIQILFFTADPDWVKHMATKERINLAIMKAVAARGLSFAFPTQTIHLEGYPQKGAPLGSVS